MHCLLVTPFLACLLPVDAQLDDSSWLDSLPPFRWFALVPDIKQAVEDLYPSRSGLLPRSGLLHRSTVKP